MNTEEQKQKEMTHKEESRRKETDFCYGMRVDGYSLLSAHAPEGYLVDS